MTESGLVVEGLKEQIDALRIIDPEMKKRLNKEMKQAVQPIIRETKSRVPERVATYWGKWRGVLDWDAAKVRRGITVSTGSGSASNGVRGQFRLMNKSAPGVAFESMGRGKGYSRAGQVLIRNMDLYDTAPRLLIHTWREQRGMTKVAGAMKGVVNQIQERVNQAAK